MVPTSENMVQTQQKIRRRYSACRFPHRYQYNALARCAQRGCLLPVLPGNAN